ncbi:hypothetical protein MCHIJ_41730 [Mycolicibacterium chitae]|nr:hypothetical protein MCHIJ_41730 [Mycolicibacterium chitae]
MDQGPVVQSFAQAEVGEQVDAGLFQDSGAHSLLHVIAGAALDDDAVNTLKVQHMAQNEARGPGTDDGNLAAHGRPVLPVVD